MRLSIDPNGLTADELIALMKIAFRTGATGAGDYLTTLVAARLYRDANAGNDDEMPVIWKESGRPLEFASSGHRPA